ncbi:hypothetical protein N7462_010157 [Penicillium macrosclerotiorum]|uniref:uncharacterized protein n=1 Tax=Penicillium macrosclerotiorum TaxID=303699 RepID=UPI0025485E2D|nr:uncharacterized protein N7462_010157 [Penicillium macrosclerotiorum]KAJ5669087.1 hypothetical protein N7462_010157 [Penicillium macrosclerotiorum]
MLTIEGQRSDTTFYFTFIPVDARSTSYAPIQNQSAPCDSKISSKTSELSSCKKRKRQRFSTLENCLLIKLKYGKKLSWQEITAHFPDRNS